MTTYKLDRELALKMSSNTEQDADDDVRAIREQLSAAVAEVERLERLCESSR